MNKSCQVNSCANRYYAKGYCEKHYQRVKTTGSPDDKKWTHSPLEFRFWSRVDKGRTKPSSVGSPCWIWTGYAVKGYGQVWFNGRNERAHRLAWILVHGQIPEELIVLHKCDTPRCVNVDHLRLGTQADNVNDCREKGRRVQGDHRGEKCWTAKLTADKVRAIRADSRTHRMIAKEYGMDYSSISDIKRRKTWTHIE